MLMTEASPGFVCACYVKNGVYNPYVVDEDCPGRLFRTSPAWRIAQPGLITC